MALERPRAQSRDMEEAEGEAQSLGQKADVTRLGARKATPGTPFVPVTHIST